MKIYFRIVLLILPLCLMSCATKPVSSKLIEIAKPAEIEAPDTEVIESKFNEVEKAAERITDEVVSAKQNIEELEKRVEDGEEINSDFEDAIKELAEENRDKMLLFNERFSSLYSRTSDVIKELKNSLDGALADLRRMDIRLSEANAEITAHKSTIAESEKEKKGLRELVETLKEARAADEVYKGKADSRLKFVWITWCLVIFIVLVILAQLRFKIL